MKKKVFAVNSALLIGLLGTTVLTAESYADARTENAEARAAMGDIDWNAEDMYWRENYTSRPYVEPGRDYSDYRPAYQYGADLYDRHDGQDYNQLDETALRDDWQTRYGDTGMDWNDARGPVMDSYNRLYENDYATDF